MLQQISPAFIAHSPAFADVLGDAPQLERVVDTDAHEGPVCVWTEHALYFTTSRPEVAIRRLDLAHRHVTTLRASTLAANGMTLGPDGRLLLCEQGAIDELSCLTGVGGGESNRTRLGVGSRPGWACAAAARVGAGRRWVAPACS